MHCIDADCPVGQDTAVVAPFRQQGFIMRIDFEECVAIVTGAAQSVCVYSQAAGSTL